jgi:hypothetical protein
MKEVTTKTPSPYATEDQFESPEGSVLCVHVMPSVDVAAVEVADTATNTPSPYVTDTHPAWTGSVLCVQVIPSVEVAAVDDSYATATKTGAYKNDLVFCDADVPRIGMCIFYPSINRVWYLHK